VLEKIPEILNSRKARDGALVGILVLTGTIAFGLGRLSVESPQTAGVALYHMPPAAEALVTQGTVSNEVPGTDNGQYVASRNGSVYHFPWCSGAQRIQDTNKVWFASKQAAEQAGYRPAKNCKGL
jgi:hypothetical protein